ncbi:hypothetical protein G6F56_011933 [Rhizopus delemar]|nr:hypothetical protein G6F56_011933 [Rhizopus delemar]
MSRKGYCVVRASLRQKGTSELCSIEDYNRNEWTDKLQAMITMGNMDAEEGLTHYTDCPKPFDLKNLVPHQFEWMKDFLNVRFDTRFFSHNNQPGRAEVNQQIGFKDKAVDFKSIPYFCDMFVPPPIMLGDVVHGGPIWTPTMQLEVQFKQKIKKDTKDILVHFISYHIINNRADIDGQIWDKEGRVLALTRHQCLLVPWSKNKSKI